MKIVNQIIRDLDGMPLVERASRPDIEPLPMTVASTLCHVALQPPAEGQPPYSADHSVERLEFAIAARRASPFGTFEVSKDMAKALRKDIPRFFAPLLAGQLLLVLDGKELPITGEIGGQTAGLKSDKYLSDIS